MTRHARPDGRVIENVGAEPDIPYRIRAEDLATDFAPMRKRILDALGREGPPR